MNSHRRQCLRAGIGLGLLAGVGNPAMLLAAESLTSDSSSMRKTLDRLVWRERLLTGFGTSLWLRAADQSADKVDTALDRAVQKLRMIESQMSLFDEHSAVSRLNRNGVLNKPDADLLRVLNLSSLIARRSNGAFDISMQPLWDLWAQAQIENRMPSAHEMQQARQRVNWRAIEANASLVRLPGGMALSLNGIAQGYAADVLRAQMQAMGIHHAMLDTGETAVIGQGPEFNPWRFGIEDVHADRQKISQQVTVPDGYAMATSSDAHTVFTEDRLNHHIVDPHSGYSPQHWSSVTVVARSAALADGLTKVFFMAPPSRIKQIASNWQVAVILQDKQGRWTRVGA